MKPLNPNRARLLLLFTRIPSVKMVNQELEYYQSDDERLIGFVSLDKVDNTYHAFLFDRNSLARYENVDMKLDHTTIAKARNSLAEMMDNYVHDEEQLKKKGLGWNSPTQAQSRHGRPCLSTLPGRALWPRTPARSRRTWLRRRRCAHAGPRTCRVRPRSSRGP